MCRWLPNREITLNQMPTASQAVDISMRLVVLFLYIHDYFFSTVCENLFICGEDGVRFIECIFIQVNVQRIRTQTRTHTLSFTDSLTRTCEYSISTAIFSFLLLLLFLFLDFPLLFTVFVFTRTHSFTQELVFATFMWAATLYLLLWDFSFFVVELWLVAFVSSIKLMAVPLCFQLCN